jgi:hypothetical protein
MHSEKSLLDDLARVALIAQQPHRNGECSPLVTLHQLPECLLVAVLRLFDKDTILLRFE